MCTPSDDAFVNSSLNWDLFASNPIEQFQLVPRIRAERSSAVIMHPWASTFEYRFPGAFPELFVFLALSTILLYGAFLGTRSTAPVVISLANADELEVSANKRGAKINIERFEAKDSDSALLARPLAWVGIWSLLLAALLVVERPLLRSSFFHNSVLLDPFIRMRKTVILLAGSAVLIIGMGYIKQEQINAFEYIVLILFAILGMLFLVSSQDLITFYLAIEMQRLSLYALAAFKRDSAFSTEAGLKYFILGALSSGLLLLGASLLYGFTGTTNFSEMATFFAGIDSTFNSTGGRRVDLLRFTIPGISLGIICLRASLLFKVSAAPFHAWAPDVYEGAPTSVTAFFAIVPKFAVFALIFRLFFYTFYEVVEVWQPFFLLCALASMLIATFSALYQRKLKRFLAFRSIGHVGYMLVGLGTGTVEGLQSVMIYLFIYLVTTLCAFAFVLSLRIRRRASDANLQEGLDTTVRNLVPASNRPFYLHQLNGLGTVNPLLAFTFAIMMFSIAGTPPLAGFMAKMLVFFSAMERSFYLLAIVGVLTSVVSAFYYLRFIKVMYFDPSSSWVVFEETDKEKSMVLAVTFLVLLLLFLYPRPLFLLAHEAGLWILF